VNDLFTKQKSKIVLKDFLDKLNSGEDLSKFFSPKGWESESEYYDYFEILADGLSVAIKELGKDDAEIKATIEECSLLINSKK
jgi:hypothetical protein